jgi:D-alanyl-D-alanine dipeptidase
MPPPWWTGSSSTCAISAATTSSVKESTATSGRAACCRDQRPTERDLAARGLGLKVFDCYRPQRAVAQFVRWAQRIDDVKRKREFYPDVDKRDLFKEGYISDRSGHSRGSTVDLTLVRRADARELDMGSPFDFFSPKSWPSDTSVSDQAQKNRALLAAAMTRGGFRPYDKEWWHFTLNNEPFPETYFDFPVR